jgi:ribosomal-protein-alanine N-acetyltransferase
MVSPSKAVIERDYKKDDRMNQCPSIQGMNVKLRRPMESDIFDYFNYGRDKEIERMYGKETRNLTPLTIDEARAYIENFFNQKYKWCIEFEERCIGKAGLKVNDNDRKARYSVGIFDSSILGKSLGTEVTQLILQFAFEELKLHRVDLRVLEYNLRAIACYEKCGFVKEGFEREGAFVDDKFETDVIMSILDREYKAIRDQFIKMRILR